MMEEDNRWLESMRRYLALLRAINVGGHRIIRMADLKKTINSLGFGDVVTHIQSGNVFFNSDISDTQKLEETVQHAIRDDFGFDVTVMVRTPEEMSRAVEKNPFKHLDESSYKIYVAFLARRPDDRNIVALTSQSSQHESFVVDGGHAFISLDRAFKGKVLFSNNFIEKQLKVRATTRNIKVTRRLAEISGESFTK